MDGQPARATIRKGPGGYAVEIHKKRFLIRPATGGAYVDGTWRRIATTDIEEGAGPVGARAEGRRLEVRPPMPGRVVRVLIRPNDAVRRGQPLVVLEAMKMQNEIAAPAAGVVEAVRVREGDHVAVHDLLAVLRAS